MSRADQRRNQVEIYYPPTLLFPIHSPRRGVPSLRKNEKKEIKKSIYAQGEKKSW